MSLLRKKLRTFATGGAVALLALCGCKRSDPDAGRIAPDAAKPNVIFILHDTMRADRIGAYGNGDQLTPNIDKLAAEGALFERCVATAPWTLPSVASIFVSYYPSVHKATNYNTVAAMERGAHGYQSVLSDEFETIAEVLKVNGYQTAGFCANSFIRQRYGFAQGFDHFDTSFAANTVRGDVVNAAALEWLDANRDPDKPLYLYLHYMDAHGPYHAAARFLDPLMERVEAYPDKHLMKADEAMRLLPYLRNAPPDTTDPTRFRRLGGYHEYWQARYDAGVAEGDFYFGEMIKELRARQLWDDALVVFVADHGEALCEHNIWGHGYSQYQTDLHVPYIVRWPGKVPAGGRVSQLTSLLDVLPTMLDQLRLPPGENLQGISQVDAMFGKAPPMPRICMAESIKAGPPQFAVFQGTSKLILRGGGETAEGGAIQLLPELYDLASDPGETTNLAHENQTEAQKLLAAWRKIEQGNRTVKPGVVAQHADVEADVVENLRALGYAGESSEDAADGTPIEPNETPTSAPASGPGTQSRPATHPAP